MRRGCLLGMIVLCPTRKLARQVEEELSILCKPLGLFSVIFQGNLAQTAAEIDSFSCYLSSETLFTSSMLNHVISLMLKCPWF
jgi:hypothetical protein